MIGEDDTARLADFGIISVVMNLTDQWNTSKIRNSNRVGYMAPELLDLLFYRLDGNLTKEIDIYSLAMTAYEARSFCTARDH